MYPTGLDAEADLILPPSVLRSFVRRIPKASFLYTPHNEDAVRCILDSTGTFTTFATLAPSFEVGSVSNPFKFQY